MDETVRCAWCERVIVTEAGRGRPRRFCRSACRQRAYELRRRQREGALSPDEIPIPIVRWRELQDRLYELTAALEDVETDLAGSPGSDDYVQAFAHLYGVASRLRKAEVVPSG